MVEEEAYRESIHIFRDRFHAGEILAQKIKEYYVDKIGNISLLAIPAGGVPVGYRMAKELNITFDIIIIRKIQIPWNPEAGFGAVAWDGQTLLNMPLVQQLGLTEESIENAISLTKRIVEERNKKFRGDKPPPDFKDRIIVLADDGLASGFTMLTTVKTVRRRDPKAIVVAVPTASQRAIELLAPDVDQLICLNIRSSPIFAVADAYMKWYDLSDEEVIELLQDV